MQLQVVCFQLWESLKGQPGTTITKEDLLRLAEGQDVGRFVNTALRNFYGDALTKVLGDARTKAYNDRHEDELITEEHLRNWFDKELITEQKTRGLVNRGPTHTGSLPNVAVDLLQRQFIVRTESRAGSTWYELVHDRFISPIMESNRAWWSARAVEDPVLRAAQLWEGQGRDPELLFTGKLLDQVQQQVDVRTAHPLVQEFIEASRKLSARKLEEAERQRDEAERRAEAFGALATREQAQSQRLKKQTRQLTAAVAAAVFLLVVAVILAIRAQDNEQIAKEEAAKATAAQMKLESLTLAQRANDALDDQDIERGVALAIAASGIMTDSSRLPASVYHALARAMYASNLITTVHTRLACLHHGLRASPRPDAHGRRRRKSRALECRQRHRNPALRTAPARKWQREPRLDRSAQPRRPPCALRGAGRRRTALGCGERGTRAHAASPPRHRAGPGLQPGQPGPGSLRRNRWHCRRLGPGDGAPRRTGSLRAKGGSTTLRSAPTGAGCCLPRMAATLHCGIRRQVRSGTMLCRHPAAEMSEFAPLPSSTTARPSLPATASRCGIWRPTGRSGARRTRERSRPTILSTWP